jgi:tRNA pseudouridine55 synthase
MTWKARCWSVSPPLPGLDSPRLEAALEPFRGAILQRPPQVSAVHVQGERAHVRARRGENLDLAARPVTIHRLELLHVDAVRGRIELEVCCSAGTYIRSLARDLGEVLGGGGALASLRRTGTLGFALAQAVPLARLDTSPPPALCDPLTALAHLPRHHLGSEEVVGWRCGRPLVCDRLRESDQAVAVLTPEGQLAGIALAQQEGLLLPKLVFDAAG